MSDTPRTDLVEFFIHHTVSGYNQLPRPPEGFVSSEFSRALEREIYELKKQLENKSKQE